MKTGTLKAICFVGENTCTWRLVQRSGPNGQWPKQQRTVVLRCLAVCMCRGVCLCLLPKFPAPRGWLHFTDALHRQPWLTHAHVCVFRKWVGSMHVAWLQENNSPTVLLLLLASIWHLNTTGFCIAVSRRSACCFPCLSLAGGQFVCAAAIVYKYWQNGCNGQPGIILFLWSVEPPSFIARKGREKALCMCRVVARLMKRRYDICLKCAEGT